jgi:3-phenylpropionate/cinnamic acid dioxygenase small subunit
MRVPEMTSEDRWDVFDLIARYAEFVDEGDVDGYVNSFTPDGVIEHTAGRCEGHAEIRPWVAELLSVHRIGPHSRLRHVLGLPIIRGDGEHCTARTYVMIPRREDTGVVTLPLVGTYIDSCVKVNGRWLFAKRIIQMDLIATAAPGR